jgi:hypothetical protein
VVNVYSASAYNGLVTFACASSLPTGATCAFSPAASVSVPLPLNVSISTAPGGSTSSFPQNSLPESMRWATLGVLSLVALVAVVTSWIGGRRRWHARVALITAAAFLFILASASCGGGSNSATSDPPAAATPAGRYPILLTGTSADGTTRSVNLTLIVQ